MKAWCGEIRYFERVVRYRSVHLHNDWTNILIRLSERITIHCVLTLISIRKFHLWSSTCHGCVIFHTTAGHTVMRCKIWRCWPPQKATENDISTSIVVLCYLFYNTCTCFVCLPRSNARVPSPPPPSHQRRAYPKPDSLRYSLAYSHISYSIPSYSSRTIHAIEDCRHSITTLL